MVLKPIRVLVVEDSPVTQELLTFILSSDPQLQVIAHAANGEEALQAVERLKPDVVTMDIHMPKLDGIEATRRIMQTVPLPIVIVSTSTVPGEVQTTFKAMEAGAVAVVEKPPGPGHPGHAQLAQKLVETVRLMSEVRVIRRWRRRQIEPTEDDIQQDGRLRTITGAPAPARQADIELIAVGTSTGGPQALQALLAELPADFPVPILVVQHITAGFLPGLVQWLNHCTPMQVQVAEGNEQAQPGHVYLAPDGVHMGVKQGRRIALSDASPENGLRPAVSYLFRSVAETLGGKAVGVLMTGMGKDGAQELKLMRDRGAVTMAQDAESSVIHGMPGEAIALGAAEYILPPARIATTLATLVSKN